MRILSGYQDVPGRVLNQLLVLGYVVILLATVAIGAR
jgi:hypothetical protein